MRRIGSVAPLALGLVLACATKAETFGEAANEPDAGGAPVAAVADPDAGDLGDVTTPDAGPSETFFYVHDNTTLYRVDPKDPKLGLAKVGDFDCIQSTANPPAGMASSMTDLAVDGQGRLFGVGSHTLFLDMKINGGKVECSSSATQLGPDGGSARFYGASFAPAGLLEPQKESLLVANTDGELYLVDTTTGALTLVGNFGTVPQSDGNGHKLKYPGTAWELSGDIVFADNGGSPVGFATLRDCKSPPASSNCNAIDTLVEIDMSALSTTNPGILVKSVRGQIVKGAGCQDGTRSGYGSIFGVAAFGSDIFGFSNDGLVVRVDNATGAACLVADDSGIFANGNRGFTGAGVSTRVAVVKPPPK
jgi:hypothetical protein